MARLSTKHPTQTLVTFSDFSGGLNTSVNNAGIEMNQLSECVNMEVDPTTGRLKTVSGTVDVMAINDGTIYAALHDAINHALLLVMDNREVRVTDFVTTKKVGTLVGDKYPIGATWEDGLLIASGGKLQYYNGEELLTLEDSPEACNGVYVRSGRVVVYQDNEIRYSAVGDETNWTENDNDDSASKFIEAGYKDGGKFIGMVSLSQDVLIIKDNRRVYRLSGEYPDWEIVEVSRNIECVGRRSFANMANAVFILGGSEVQVLQPTESYDEVKPENAGARVASEIQGLPKDAIVRYLPALQQFWFIGAGGLVLLFSVAQGAWYKRQFNSSVVDAFCVGTTVYVVKKDRVSKLDGYSFEDAGRGLQWRFRTKRLSAHNELFLKRTQLTLVPMDASNTLQGNVQVGAVNVPFPATSELIYIYGNKSPVFGNHLKIHTKGRHKGVYAKKAMVYGNTDPIYGNIEPICNMRDILKDKRQVYRSKFLEVSGKGSGAGYALSSITLDLVEV